MGRGAAPRARRVAGLARRVHRAPERQRGFSLFEILLALMVVGLSVGLGVSLLGQQLERDKSTRTLANTERVAQALGAFVAANRRLPCAANPDANPLLGTEVDSAACAAGQRGLVPWSTLGLQRRDVEDGHGRLLSYHVDPAFAATSAATLAELCDRAPSPAALQAFVSVSGTLEAPDFTNPLLEGQRIGFVLLSHGPDGFGARAFNSSTLRAGPATPVPAGRLAEGINAVSASGPGFVQYIDRDRGLTEADSFDDLLFYKALPTFVALYSGSVC